MSRVAVAAGASRALIEDEAAADETAAPCDIVQCTAGRRSDHLLEQAEATLLCRRPAPVMGSNTEPMKALIDT